MSPMETLAKKASCLSCHQVDGPGVGPAYRLVAQKYAKDKKAADKLVKKVKEGGVGVWGKVPMPPMGAEVNEADIKSLVAWILAGAK